jgi:Cu(I)/Ag(I) efflux system membrane protein CusA/SilA
MISTFISWTVENKALILLLLVCFVATSVWAIFEIKIDAIPDLSDVQVIIRTDFPGQSPQVVEDQVTYPITTSLLGVPGARSVRGYSMVGTSFVYVIFEDGTNIYWARSRVQEQMNTVTDVLPESARPQLGPDATGVGWIYQYVLLTGPYCPDHPQGLWQNLETGEWAEEPGEKSEWQHQRIFRGQTECPLHGKKLQDADVDLAELRSLQDWYLAYELTSLDGVSEVASIGGHVKQYQVTIDPVALRAYNLSLSTIKNQIRSSNSDTGGRLLEMGETEFMVRSRGYLGDRDSSASSGLVERRTRSRNIVEDLNNIAVGSSEGSPLYLRDVATITTGPEIRRGIAEWNGEGETAGGIVVMRYGENASDTIDRVTERLAELIKGLPAGVGIATGYDRSDLIHRAIGTLSKTLVEEMLIVALICVIFLLHARSALVAAIVLPSGVMGSVLIMHMLGINANIMSLGGIAIAIGVMVDSSVIMVENAHAHLAEKNKSHKEAIVAAAQEVGPTLFFSLLVITISFLPVFALQEQAGRLFKPLAFTKTFAMGLAAILAVTIIPPLMALFVREEVLPRTERPWFKYSLVAVIVILPALLLLSLPASLLAGYNGWLALAWVILALIIVVPQRILPEEKNPLTRLLVVIYNPLFTFSLRHRWLVIGLSVVLIILTIFPFINLGSEFMPPLEEGDFLYMPNTDPGLSITKAKELLQQTDKLIKQFPEVVSVMGKIGRSETATDPAPLTMIETTIMLERDKSKWRQVKTDGPFGLFPSTRPITLEELTDGYEIPGGARVPGINDALNIPGLTGALTRGSMPIKTRIDMLATGIRTAVGIKVMGDDLDTITEVSNEIASLLKTDPSIRDYTASAYADKLSGGNYVNIWIDREAIARHGLVIDDVQTVVMSALGGANLTYTVEGRERYPVNLRYPRYIREDVHSIKQILVTTPEGAQIPLEQLTRITVDKGPAMLKSENGRLTSWVFVDVKDIDVGTYVEQAQNLIGRSEELPPGVSLVWSGQYEYMQRANKTLQMIIPLVLVAICILLYMSTRSWFRTILILVTLSFSVIGAIWTLYLLDYNLSVAVWIGIIALAGLDAETSLVMILYLDTSVDKARRRNKLGGIRDLWFAVQEGAVKRIRPKTMTVVTTFLALLPLMFASGAGAETMKRIAAPMIGGLITSFILELLIYPAIMFSYYRKRYIS